MSRNIEAEATAAKPTRRRRSSLETTPTRLDIKENTPPCGDRQPWMRTESTPCGHPHLQHRRKALAFVAASPQPKSPGTKDCAPSIEEAIAGKQLTERQQMSLLLQLTSNASGREVGACVGAPASRRKVKVNWKVRKRNERGETPLHVASIKGDVGAVGRLIREGAEINSRDYAGWTPLHEAAIHGHPNIVAKLLKKGADPNPSGMDNDSPLHDAAANNHREVVQILLENGAIPDQRNMKGEQPVDLATDESIIFMLKQHSCKISGAAGADKLQETNTTNNLEDLFLPIDESLETTSSHEVEENFDEITSPAVSPISSKDNSLQFHDVSTGSEIENLSLDCHQQFDSTSGFKGSTSMETDDLICKEEIHLDPEPDQLPVHKVPFTETERLLQYQEDSATNPTIKSIEDSLVDGLTNQMDDSDFTKAGGDVIMMSHVEDKLFSEIMTSTLETRDGEDEGNSVPHSDDNQDNEVYTCNGTVPTGQINSPIPVDSSLLNTEIQQYSIDEINSFDAQVATESKEANTSTIKGKKRILRDWKNQCQVQREDTIAIQPSTKGNMEASLPPGFEQTLTHTKLYTLQTVPLQSSEQCFFELFPPRDTPESLRLKHKIEKEKLLMAFEQQVLHAVDECHSGPKPVTFCGLLATTKGWHLVKPPSQNNDTNDFNMEKYTELLQSIQENYDKATLQLACRQQLEMETLWACSSQQTRKLLSSQLSDEGRLTSSREKFTVV